MSGDLEVERNSVENLEKLFSTVGTDCLSTCVFKQKFVGILAKLNKKFSLRRMVCESYTDDSC
jgi:hypothetical protein